MIETHHPPATVATMDVAQSEIVLLRDFHNN